MRVVALAFVAVSLVSTSAAADPGSIPPSDPSEAFLQLVPEIVAAVVGERPPDEVLVLDVESFAAAGVLLTGHPVDRNRIIAAVGRELVDQPLRCMLAEPARPASLHLRVNGALNRFSSLEVVVTRIISRAGQDNNSSLQTILLTFTRRDYRWYLQEMETLAGT